MFQQLLLLLLLLCEVLLRRLRLGLLLGLEWQAQYISQASAGSKNGPSCLRL